MPHAIEFEETVSFMLARVAVLYRNAVERSMAQIGLHSGQAFLLIELWKEDSLRPVDIAARLNVKPPTVSSMLRGLEQINLVKLVTSNEDGRSSRVKLTERGRQIRSEVEKQWLDLESECLGRLSPTERLILTDVLKKLRATYTGQTLVDEE
jgi:DNA-binding MarR family transcriptional regulator